MNSSVEIMNSVEDKLTEETPFFTIITVTYNAGELLTQTINNVREQILCDFEYIVIDGASTDNTVNIIKENEDAINFWLSEDDCGLYEAMNKGISKAEGKYVIFMNAGDTFSDSDVLNKLQNSIDYKTDDVVYGDRFYIHETGGKVLQKARPIDTVFERMPFGHQSCLIKTEILQITPFNTTYKYAADYELIIKLYLKGKKFTYVDFPISNFLSGGKSESGVRPYIEALMVLFSHCSDKQLIQNNQYFKSFKDNARKIMDI